MRALVLSIFFIVFTQSALSQMFVNNASELGINHTLNSFVHWGAGVSFFDFDNDGWDDITLIQQGDSAYFYKNMGGYFELLPSLVHVPGRATQIIWVDYDNDGDNDFFLSTFDAGQCRLYQNNGSFEFTDFTLTAGLIGLTTANYGASFADYDKDGDLDLYLCRYYMEGDPLNPLNTNALYRNNGNGTFTNVTIAAGVGNGIRPSFMAVWLDYNSDSYPDLYVINDRGLWINTMYRNNGDGTFSDATQGTNTAMQYGPTADDPMSATFADFDNDGDNDIYASNTGGTTTPARFLVANNGAFTEQAAIRNVNLFQWAWGATFIDADNDSWQDLYVTTGKIIEQSSSEVRSYLYISNAGVNFTDSPQNFSNANHIAASYGVAKGDVNNDGFADLMVLNAKGFNSFLWLNSATSENNYIKVTLEGTLSNRMAIGSWIRVYSGGNTYSYYTRCGENYCSQNSQHHIFGLGTNTSVDSITVTYLSGITDVYYDVQVNEHHFFTEGETLVFQLSDFVDTTICENNTFELLAPEFSSYLWSNGATTQSIVVSESGSYSLTALNEFGHVYNSDTIEIVVMNPVYISQTTSDLTCFGANNGSALLEITNQTDNYEIVWSNGSNSLTQNDLPAGSYTYIYSDEFGCSFEGSLFIDQPSEILIFSETTHQTSLDVGSIQILAIGGVPPYTYFVNGSPMNANPLDTLAGTYDVLVVDANGCESSVIVVVSYEDLSGITQFDNEDFGIFPNPTKNKEVQFFGFREADIVGLFDIQGRAIGYSIRDNTFSIHAEFTGVAQLVFDREGVKYTIRIVVF
jgi:hypothetical protein